MTAPASTYRLQISAGLDLNAAAGLADYLAALGAGAYYLSPLLPSTSDHGYDTVSFGTVDPVRGGESAWRRLLAAARGRGLGVIVDVVPNHTGVAHPAENPAWWSLLRLGPASPHAPWFDVDWSGPAGQVVLLPVLGDDVEPGQLRIEGDELRYFEHRFPIAPGTGPVADDTAARVHERQHYRLVNFRRADTDQNYRRFFAVMSLAGLRVEDPEVFEATHGRIRGLIADGAAGLRVDHPDGLADPAGYLTRLRELAGDDAWITVEKILEPGEQLPSSWPVEGTTGYDALTEVARAFVDPAGIAPLDAAYRELTGDPRTFAEHVAAGKRMIATTILRAEVLRLARLVPEVARADEAAAALTELLVAFDVYRSYLPEGADRLEAALAAVRASSPEDAALVAVLDALAPRLRDPGDELCVRFQQTSGAVMAKGVEDTAYYRYTRFVAANEVGGDPGSPGAEPAEFHAAQRRRERRAPASMTTLSTHDTKRGEDVRARLAVLAELPGEWTTLARLLMERAPLPDRPVAYLLWQTFVGAGFIEPDRMHAYAEKAMREAATSTGWIDPDAGFEAAVHDVIDRAYEDPEIREPLGEFIGVLTPHGRSNSLAQKLVQLTMPGIPDVYHGTELWDDSLVDPDNRRPVDFAARADLIERLDRAAEAGRTPPIDGTGAAKAWVVSRALRLRRDRPELFARYAPLAATGPATDHLLAFDRGGAITLATRLPAGLERAGGWRETRVDLPAGIDVLTGARHGGPTAVADLLARYPVALLVRDEEEEAQ
ncbi:malto-oligosyltrehalose synthase [Pseudactinotalea sp. HY158]|uniref:malto-oligosyltrehalose synthase n=1 Tax=Pseudactinotalea sp. HY158 TaxID=2654547 RepID=UPI00129C8A1D|nr:malto-oligosyltrehalose synthase [Pseudactinotalea sp. HY158]QGH68306.1 malto-oligosyltrehalose synthase [Pseudactinotalea sp. HY158]